MIVNMLQSTYHVEYTYEMTMEVFLLFFRMYGCEKLIRKEEREMDELKQVMNVSRIRDANEPDVVVIDDDESMCEGCRQTLEEVGYRAAVARNGIEGIQLIAYR